MKYLLCILLMTQIGANEIIAQINSDSLSVVKIDSIIEARYKKEFWGTDLTKVQILDSTDNKTVIGRFKEGQLIDIVYLSAFGECEIATFHVFENALVFVEYRLSEPDIRSNAPPNTTHKFYFQDNIKIFYTSSNYDGGARTCDAYSVENKDFIKEFNYYTALLLE